MDSPIACGVMRRFSLLRYSAAVLAVGLASAAGAQESAPKEIQTVPFPILGIGGGISVPAGGFAKGRVPGFNLSALAEFRTPSEPLGIRAEALYQPVLQRARPSSCSSYRSLRVSLSSSRVDRGWSRIEWLRRES